MTMHEIKQLLKPEYPTKSINHPDYDGYTDGFNSALRKVLEIMTLEQGER